MRIGRRIGRIWLIGLIGLLAGCEVIPSEKQLIPLPNAEPESNALLVEFTGFLCVNCPTAAEEAQRLQKTYPDNLVVVAMHPKDNHFTQTGKPEYDYTCPEANVYYNWFDGSSTTPFPTGIVDMQRGWLDYTSWATAVLTSIMQKKAGWLELQISDVNEDERSFNVSADVWAADDAQLLLWLVADSVLGAQMMPDGSTNLAYTHRHMLRASITEDPWGIKVTGSNLAQLGRSAEPCSGLQVTEEQDPVQTREISYVVTDSIGGKELPLSDYSVVGVLVEAESMKLIDVQQKEIKER